MEVEENLLETPDAFLKALGENLSAKEGVDTDLMGILIAHILKTKQAETAITEAKDAILKLAAERANAAMVLAAND